MGEIGREPGKVDTGVDKLFDAMDATTGWAALGNDTLNLATTTNHILGTAALTFDKVNGAANTTVAGIAKTLTSVNLSNYTAEDVIVLSCLIPSLTDVASIFVRIGTSSSHYNTWTVADTSLTANQWLTITIPIGSNPTITGNGWSPIDIDYVAVGVNFDAEANTLSGIIFDHIGIQTASLGTSISGGVVGGGATSVNVTQVNSEAVDVGAGTEAAAIRVTLPTNGTGQIATVSTVTNLSQQGGVAISLNTGVRDTGTQRVTIATNDIVPASQSGTWTEANSAAALTALQLIDNAVSGAGFNITQFNGEAIDVGAGTEAAALRVTLPTDGTGVVGVTGAALTALQLIDNIVSGAGVNVTQVNGEAIDVGAGTEAAAIRVTLPTDGTGKVSAAQSGTWTEANSAAIAASASVVDDWDNAASDGASVSGDVAHGASDAGEPVKVGYKGYTFDGTIPQTAVTEGQRVNAISDLQGIQYVQTAHPFFFSASVDYGAAQTNATVKAAPGAGSLYITDIFLSNGAVAGNVTLLNGSGGAVLWECYPGINGGASFHPKNPIKLTATTLLAITSTSCTTHSLTVCGFTA